MKAPGADRCLSGCVKVHNMKLLAIANSHGEHFFLYASIIARKLKEWEMIDMIVLEIKKIQSLLLHQ